MEFGRAMGNDEAVTPILPNSDYWFVISFKKGLCANIYGSTGIAGVSGILRALILRAKNGGSYAVDVSPDEESDNYCIGILVDNAGCFELLLAMASKQLRHLPQRSMGRSMEKERESCLPALSQYDIHDPEIRWYAREEQLECLISTRFLRRPRLQQYRSQD